MKKSLIMTFPKWVSTITKVLPPVLNTRPASANQYIGQTLFLHIISYTFFSPSHSPVSTPSLITYFFSAILLPLPPPLGYFCSALFSVFLFCSCNIYAEHVKACRSPHHGRFRRDVVRSVAWWGALAHTVCMDVSQIAFLYWLRCARDRDEGTIGALKTHFNMENGLKC